MSLHPQNLSGRSVLRLMMFGFFACFSAPVFAHVGVHDVGGLSEGFIHPFSGIDHLLAMFAVGVLASQAQGKARWLLPLTFLSMMMVGAITGMEGIVMPGIEIGIATSVAVLGVMIACAVSVPLWSGACLTALFALAHGYAHGAELPQQAATGLYATGFMAATALLHLLGFSSSLFFNEKRASNAFRYLGAAIAASGLYLLFNVAVVA